MKAKNLIKMLEKVNPEAEVVLHDFNGESVTFVNVTKQIPSEVRLQTCDDVNMKEELLERFRLLDESLYKENELYKDIETDEEFERLMYQANVFQGITPDVIEKYLNKEYADRMRVYCEEHDLIL